MGAPGLLGARSNRVALKGLVAIVVAVAGLAAPKADARWLRPQLVGHSKISFKVMNSSFDPNETRPVVAFDASGGAGLVFVDGTSTFLAQRGRGGRFGPPVLFAPGSGGVVNPVALAFTKNGETVGLLHLFDDVGAPAEGGYQECCDQLAGLVRPASEVPRFSRSARTWVPAARPTHPRALATRTPPRERRYCRSAADCSLFPAEASGVWESGRS